jgi:hypothetical protein
MSLKILSVGGRWATSRSLQTFDVITQDSIYTKASCCNRFRRSGLLGLVFEDETVPAPVDIDRNSAAFVYLSGYDAPRKRILNFPLDGPL